MIESTIEIAASPDRRLRLRYGPHTVRRAPGRRGGRLDGQVQLSLLVSASWRASRCRDVGPVLTSLTVIPISDLVIWLVAAGRLAKASEHLTGVLVLLIGAHIAADDRGRASVHGHVASRRAHEDRRFRGGWSDRSPAGRPSLATGTQGDRLRQELHHAPEQRAAFDDRPRRHARCGRRRGRRQGQDAVVCALGATAPLRRDTALADGMRNVVAATERHGVRRLVCLSVLGVHEARPQLSVLGRWLLAPLLVRNVVADHQVEERGIRDCAIARPPHSPTPGAEERIEAGVGVREHGLPADFPGRPGGLHAAAGRRGHLPATGARGHVLGPPSSWEGASSS